MKWAVIVFPGSNCDQDMYYAVQDGLEEAVDYVWYTETDLSRFDAVLLPGGFSYGDYLRCGAIARFAPVLDQVGEAAAQGKLVLGVCNGFQILLEAGLLPGAMTRNHSLRFHCAYADLVVANNETPFTTGFDYQEVIRIPIAHGEGSYHCDAATLEALRSDNRIVFRYAQNPNGSVDDIAGIINQQGNVLGMMPHPERAVETLLGSDDGLRLFTSMLKHWRHQHARV